MKLQSIFYTDFYGQQHPSGIISFDVVTSNEAVLRMRQLLDDPARCGMQSISAFSESGRFFLVNRHSFSIVYCGSFTPAGDEIKPNLLTQNF